MVVASVGVDESVSVDDATGSTYIYECDTAHTQSVISLRLSTLYVCDTPCIPVPSLALSVFEPSVDPETEEPP